MTLDEFLRAFESLVDDREASEDPGEGNYGCEDCRACNHCRFCIGCDSCEDCTYCEESLDCTSCTQSKRCVGCKKVSYCEDSRDCKGSRYLTLCVDCSDCTHCLACVGLEGGEFYVLNEKRPRKEYFALLRQVQELMLARRDGGWRPPGIGLASDVFDQAVAGRDTELSAAPWLVEFIALAAAEEHKPDARADDYDELRESEVTVQRSVGARVEQGAPAPERDYARARERAPDRDYGREGRESRESRESRGGQDGREGRESGGRGGRGGRGARAPDRDFARERVSSRPRGLAAARAPVMPEEDYRRSSPEREPRRGEARAPMRPSVAESTRELEPPRSAAPSARPPTRARRQAEAGERDPGEESNHDWMREPPAFGTHYAEPREERGRAPRTDYGHDLGRALGPEDDYDKLDSSPSPSEASHTQTYQRGRYEPEDQDEESYARDADVPSPRAKEQPTQPFLRQEGRPSPSSGPSRPRLNTPRPPTREGKPVSAIPIDEGAPRPRGQEASSPWLDEQPTQAHRLAKRGSLRRAGRPARPNSAEEEREGGEGGEGREGTGSESFGLGGEGTHTGLRLGRKPKRRE